MVSDLPGHAGSVFAVDWAPNGLDCDFFFLSSIFFRLYHRLFWLIGTWWPVAELTRPSNCRDTGLLFFAGVFFLLFLHSFLVKFFFFLLPCLIFSYTLIICVISARYLSYGLLLLFLGGEGKKLVYL